MRIAAWTAIWLAVATGWASPSSSAPPGRPASLTIATASPGGVYSSACNSATERVSSSVRACNSPKSRAFSIAITAWSAKVRTSSICLSVNGSTRCRASRPRRRARPRARRHPERVRKLPTVTPRASVFEVGRDVSDMDGAALERDAAEHSPAIRCDRSISSNRVPLGAHGMRRYIVISLALAIAKCPI